MNWDLTAKIIIRLNINTVIRKNIKKKKMKLFL